MHVALVCCSPPPPPSPPHLTPAQDSLVIGGNFLHGFDMAMQIRVVQTEERGRVPRRFRTPYMTHMWLYAAAAYLLSARTDYFAQAVKRLKAGEALPEPWKLGACVCTHPRVWGWVGLRGRGWGLGGWLRRWLHCAELHGGGGGQGDCVVREHEGWPLLPCVAVALPQRAPSGSWRGCPCLWPTLPPYAAPLPWRYVVSKSASPPAAGPPSLFRSRPSLPLSQLASPPSSFPSS